MTVPANPNERPYQNITAKNLYVFATKTGHLIIRFSNRRIYRIFSPARARCIRALLMRSYGLAKIVQKSIEEFAILIRISPLGQAHSPSLPHHEERPQSPRLGAWSKAFRLKISPTPGCGFWGHKPSCAIPKIRENISPTFLSYPDEADSKRNDVDKRLFVLIKAAKCLGQQGSGGIMHRGNYPVPML